MSLNRTKIEWVTKGTMVGYTWNPLGWGCNGTCPWCYARRMAKRGMSKCSKCLTYEPHFHPERLHGPAMLRQPARIFVCSMSDLFGPWNDPAWIKAILCIVGVNPEHEFLLLTKHPEVMQQYPITANAWAGVTVTNQADADERIPLLLQTPAAHRFVSVEPMLGPVQLRTRWLFESHNMRLLGELHWIIVGGLTPKPVHKPKWVWDLIAQCESAGVPLFLKDNLKSVIPNGSDWDRWRVMP